MRARTRDDNDLPTDAAEIDAEIRSANTTLRDGCARIERIREFDEARARGER